MPELVSLPSFQRSIAALNEILTNYVDHGVLLTEYDCTGDWRKEVWPRWRREQREIGFASNVQIGRQVCRSAARDLGWRMIRAHKTLQDRGPSVSMYVENRAADAVAGLLLIAESVERVRWNIDGSWVHYRPKVIHFMFTGDQHVALFDAWYAGCYHSPDHVRAITKRGRPIHTYPGGNNGPQTSRERSLEAYHHAL